MDKWIKKITPKRPKRSHVHENPATFSKPITASTSLQPQPQAASAPWQPTPLQPTSSALPPASSPSTPPTIEQSTTDLLFNATRQGLTLVKETLDGVPVPGLKGAIGGLLCILEMLDQRSSNKQEALDLTQRLSYLDAEIQKSLGDVDEEQLKRTKLLTQELHRISKELQMLVVPGRTKRLINSREDSAKISGLISQTGVLINDYILFCGMSVKNDTSAIRKDSGAIWNSLRVQDRNAMREKLRPVVDASWDCGTRSSCLLGTREGLLADIENWAHNPADRRIFWLNGLAGTGKTTVAQSVARLMADKKCLGASFFCSRASANLSDVKRIFSTIAYQLSHYAPKIGEAVLAALEEHENVAYTNPDQQIEKLIAKPLQNISFMDHAIIVVVDALDECKDNESTSTILEVLSQHMLKLPFLKFFITSRPESHLRVGFRQQPVRLLTHIFLLHNIEYDVVQNDIRVFLNFRLKNIAANRSDISLPSPWPPEDSVEALLEQCDALFIYAFTACVFIESRFHDPRRRLDILSSSAKGATASTGIDKLYADIFSVAFDGTVDSEVFSHLRQVLGAVVLLFDPLSLHEMGRILGLQPSDIRRALKHLHSVVIVPDRNEGFVRTFHASFHDFLTDNNRCRDSRFHVSPSSCHAQLALSCLQSILKDLPDHLKLVPVQEVYESSVQGSFKALNYSSRHWANHLAEVAHDEETIESLIRSLREFLASDARVERWVAVVRGLSGMTGGPLSSINKAIKWCSGLSMPQDRDELQNLLSLALGHLPLRRSGSIRARQLGRPKELIDAFKLAAVNESPEVSEF